MHIYIEIDIYIYINTHNSKEICLPGRIERCSKIILRHAQKSAQGSGFGIFQDDQKKPNPKTMVLKP